MTSTRFLDNMCITDAGVGSRYVKFGVVGGMSKIDIVYKNVNIQCIVYRNVNIQYLQGTKHMQLGGTTIRRYSSTIPNLGSWWGLIQLQLFIWKGQYSSTIPNLSSWWGLIQLFIWKVSTAAPSPTWAPGGA